MSNFIEADNSLININELECVVISDDKLKIELYFKNGDKFTISDDNALEVEKIYENLRKVLCDE